MVYLMVTLRHYLRALVERTLEAIFTVKLVVIVIFFNITEKKVLPAVVLFCTLVYTGIAAKFYNEEHF